MAASRKQILEFNYDVGIFLSIEHATGSHLHFLISF